MRSLFIFILLAIHLLCPVCGRWKTHRSNRSGSSIEEQEEGPRKISEVFRNLFRGARQRKTNNQEELQAKQSSWKITFRRGKKQQQLKHGKKSRRASRVAEESSSSQRKNRANVTEPAIIAQCSSTKRRTRNIWRRYRGASNADTAYRMAVLASLAYWEFDKRPTNFTSFRLQTDDKQSTISTFTWQSVKIAFCHVATGARLINRIVEQQYQRSNGRLRRSRSCRQTVLSESNSGLVYLLQWYLHDWHEPTPLVQKWHDTDLLVATSGDDTLVLSFAGTASAADAVTNLQTFEKVGHSGLFHKNLTGSVHRGFLNAYSRVERGKVYKIYRNDHGDTQYNNLPNSLYQRYQHCFNDTANNDSLTGACPILLFSFISIDSYNFFWFVVACCFTSYRY